MGTFLSSDNSKLRLMDKSICKVSLSCFSLALFIVTLSLLITRHVVYLTNDDEQPPIYYPSRLHVDAWSVNISQQPVSYIKSVQCYK